MGNIPARPSARDTCTRAQIEPSSGAAKSDRQGQQLNNRTARRTGGLRLDAALFSFAPRNKLMIILLRQLSQ